jgi:ABC-2 type transport system permease protein
MSQALASDGVLRATIRHEIRCAQRDRLPQLMLAVFLLMAAASALIGWLTHVTVSSVYAEAVREGVTRRPDPFLSSPPLFSVKNMVIYVSAVGALLAILVGVQSGLRERRAGVIDLVFSRPVGVRRHIVGKLAGVGLWLGLVLAVSAVLIVIGLSIAGGRIPSLADTVNLLLFFGLSWAFLVPFAALGIMSGMRSQRETTALLLPVLTWVALLFVVPQLGTAEEPISFLNPVPAQIPARGGFFSAISQVLQPLSFVTDYKKLSAFTLGFGDTAGLTVRQLDFSLMALAGVLALVILGPRLLRKGELYE